MPVTKVYANTLALSEASKLDDERLRRVVDAGSVDDALKMLADYGFALGDGTIDGFVTAETESLCAFVIENAASPAVAEALTARFWYNNVKLAYKSRFAVVPAGAYYKLDKDAGEISRGNYEECDAYLTAALEKLDAADEKKPQAIDLEITRAMYKFVCSCKVKPVRRYFRAEIDMKNILTAARLRRLGRTADEFIDGGKIDRAVLEAAADPTSEFSELFEKTPFADMAAEAETSEFKDLGRFEREADDYLFYMTDSMCADMASYTPFLNYYSKKLIELKTLKTALVCIKSDARDVFFARMPKIYE